jgi:hypothetical protein
MTNEKNSCKMGVFNLRRNLKVCLAVYIISLEKEEEEAKETRGRGRE